MAPAPKVRPPQVDTLARRLVSRRHLQLRAVRAGGLASGALVAARASKGGDEVFVRFLGRVIMRLSG